MEYVNSQLEKIIDEYIHSERDRAILKRRFIDGVKFESLAEEFDLSVRHTKYVIHKYEYTIFSKI